MTTARRIIKNTVSLLISGIFSQLLIFLTMIYLARVLGPDDFGRINFATAIVVFFTLTVNMGLPVFGTREIAKDVKQIEILIRSILPLRLSLAVLSFGVLLLLCRTFNTSITTQHLTLLYGLGLIPSALLLDWVFQGMEKMEYIGLGRILGVFIYTLLVLIFVRSSKHILFVPCFQITGNLVFALFLVAILYRTIKLSMPKISMISWSELLKRAFPIGMTSIISAIIYYFDSVLLGFIKTDIEVGYYTSAYKIILLLIMGIGTYHDSIFPTLSKFYKSSYESLTKLHCLTLKLMVLIAVPVSIGGAILARKIILFFYGNEYLGAVIAFKILIFACGLIFVNTAFSRGLWATGKERECLHIVLIQAVFVMLLNFVLIPKFGLFGAATATVSGETLSLLIFYYANSKLFDLKMLTYFLKSLVASTLMALLLLYTLQWSLFIQIVLGILCYSTVLCAVKGVTSEDLDYFRRAAMGISIKV